jgi:hypothetical protein
MSFAGKWVELEIIMLGQRSQTQKDKQCMFSLMWSLDIIIIIIHVCKRRADYRRGKICGRVEGEKG